MRTLKRQISYSGSDTVYRLYHITDTHIGAGAADERLLERDIEAIRDDSQALWLFGGDSIDAICHLGDKRYTPDTIAAWARGKSDLMGYQRDRWLELFRPIADKCVGIVNGNHEYAALKYYDRNLYWEIVVGMAQTANRPPEELGLGIRGFVVLTFRYSPENYVDPHRGTPYAKSYNLVIATHHGYGGGRLPGGHALALNRMLGDYECDIALMGHRHTRVMLDKIVEAPGGAQATHRRRLAMFVPSYLGAYVTPSSEGQPIDTYAEHMGLPPQPVGTIPIVIDPARRQFRAIISSEPGIVNALPELRK